MMDARGPPPEGYRTGPEHRHVRTPDPVSPPRKGVPQMSGPWARYGGDARPGDEDGAAENPSPPPNPYLSSGSAASAGQQPSPDAAPPAFWNRPPPPNPYLANPYLHDPVHRSPYASQTDEPHPFRTTYAPTP